MDNRKSADETVIPVIAEQLETGVRKVDKGGVRVTKTVREHNELVDLPLANEEVDVRHIAKNEVVDGPLPVRNDGDTVVIPVVKEIVRVEKQWVLTEEVHVSKKHTEEHRQENVTLRHEEVRIERIDAEGNTTGEVEG